MRVFGKKREWSCGLLLDGIEQKLLARDMGLCQGFNLAGVIGFSGPFGAREAFSGLPFGDGLHRDPAGRSNLPGPDQFNRDVDGGFFHDGPKITTESYVLSTTAS